MILRKLDENRERLLKIGHNAIERGHELGINPSCADDELVTRALKILDRVPDVDPDPGDEMPPG